MKKLLSVVFTFVMVCYGLFGQTAAPEAVFAGDQPLLVQSAFYTPSYQCIYMKGSNDLALKYTADEWCVYSAPINKDTITYDGMSGILRGYNVIRIKTNTEKPGQEVVIYIDNVTVKDGTGKVVMALDFENGDPAGVYVCSGRPLEGNGTVAVKKGKKSFLLHMSTESLYGYNGAEVQWNLPSRAGTDATWDFSTGDYTVSFDYLISVAL